ncbi:uncharacterized protein [Palaemon carinicauda]|uniref:uncharacterized protein n=1 Tax=Palaemon carinicauda TaxID=392227 RepID=UPI0035B69F4E
MRPQLADYDIRSMNDVLSRAQKLYEASKASSLGASSLFSGSSLDSWAAPSADDDKILTLMKKKPLQPMQQNHRPNPTWCFYHRQFGSNVMKCRVLKISIFLAPHGLLVDVTGKRLIDTVICRTRPLRAGPGITPISAVIAQPYATLLQEFPDVFKLELQQSPGSPSKHEVYPHINTMGPLTNDKFRRLPSQKLRDAKRAFKDMERMGICKSGVQPLGVYAPHGKETARDMEVLVFPEDVPKTAIITPFGSYTSYSTFGLSNAGTTFQRLMDSILGDLLFYVCYVDDFLIFSRTKERHWRNVRAMLKRHQENGLIMRFDKCTFGAERVDFLGDQISVAGVKPTSTKVDAMKTFPTPTTIWHL